MFGIGWKLFAASIVIISVMTIGGFFYWKWSQSQLEVLHMANAQMSQAVELQTQTIQNMTNNMKRMAVSLTIMQQQFNEIEQRTSESLMILRSHNVVKIIEKKPKLFQKIINEGTREVLQELENITDPLVYQQYGNNNE